MKKLSQLSNVNDMLILEILKQRNELLNSYKTQAEQIKKERDYYFNESQQLKKQLSKSIQKEKIKESEKSIYIVENIYIDAPYNKNEVVKMIPKSIRKNEVEVDIDKIPTNMSYIKKPLKIIRSNKFDFENIKSSYKKIDSGSTFSSDKPRNISSTKCSKFSDLSLKQNNRLSGNSCTESNYGSNSINTKQSEQTVLSIDKNSLINVEIEKPEESIIKNKPNQHVSSKKIYFKKVDLKGIKRLVNNKSSSNSNETNTQKNKKIDNLGIIKDNTQNILIKDKVCFLLKNNIIPIISTSKINEEDIVKKNLYLLLKSNKNK